MGRGWPCIARIVFLLFSGFCAAGPVALACPYSLRDSAFIGGQTAARYRLLFLVRGGGERRTAMDDWVRLAVATWLENTNVEARVLDPDDPGSHDDLEALPPGARLADRPVAWLISPDREIPALRLDFSSAGQEKPQQAQSLDRDSIMKLVARVIDSPAREKIRKHIVDSWCVALVVEGDDPGETARARQTAEEAARRIVGKETEMEKIVTRGPRVLTISAPKEKVLTWSLGLERRERRPIGNESPRVIVLVGRGETRGPLLEGAEITSARIYEIFEMLGRSCTCTTSPVWLTGRRIPIEWGPEMEEAVKVELGFDPEDPETLKIMGGVLGGLGEGRKSLGSELGLIYRETYFEPPASDGASSTPATEGMVEMVESPGLDTHPEAGALEAPPTRGGQRVLAMLAGLAAVLLALATWVILRKNGRDSRLPRVTEQR